jgi:transposase
MSGDNFSRRYSVVAEARRRWSEAEKQAVVAEAERPGVNISSLARRHGIKPSLLFRWRRLARDSQDQSTPTFVPVTLALGYATSSRTRTLPCRHGGSTDSFYCVAADDIPTRPHRCIKGR